MTLHEQIITSCQSTVMKPDSNVLFNSLDFRFYQLLYFDKTDNRTEKKNWLLIIILRTGAFFQQKKFFFHEKKLSSSCLCKLVGTNIYFLKLHSLWQVSCF